MQVAVAERARMQRSPGPPGGRRPVRTRAGVLAIPLGIMLALASLAATPASAATFDVEVFDDWPAQEPINGTCRSTRLDGKCTLRAAIMVANTLTGPQTINLPPGTYQLTRTGVDDDGRVGDLDLLRDITISSRGPGVATIAGLGFQMEDRVIHVTRLRVAALQNVVVQGGYTLNRSQDNDGGGILVDYHARLTLTDVRVRNNRARTAAASASGPADTWNSSGRASKATRRAIGTAAVSRPTTAPYTSASPPSRRTGRGCPVAGSGLVRSPAPAEGAPWSGSRPSARTGPGSTAAASTTSTPTRRPVAE